MRSIRSAGGRGPARRPPLAPTLALALWLLAALATPAAAVKTDIIILRNGDRITGEVDELARGRLTYKTDDMGTLEVEWDKVASVTAAATFEIEDLAGGLYYGSLLPSSRPATLSIGEGDTTRVIDLLLVTRISRLGATLWKRLDGSIDLGASYTSSSELFKLDFASQTSYERPGYEVGLNLSTTFSSQPGIEDTRRANAGLSFTRRRPNRWFYFGLGQLEANAELGFDLRGSLAGGGGRYLAQSRRDDLLAAGGLSVNQEVPVSGDATTNTEILASLQYSRFAYDFPKVDILVKFTVFEGLNDWGRTRVEAEARIRREMLKDFNVTLRGYESYDSKPATEGAEKNDFGLSFALGWTY